MFKLITIRAVSLHLLIDELDFNLIKRIISSAFLKKKTYSKSKWPKGQTRNLKKVKFYRAILLSNPNLLTIKFSKLLSPDIFENNGIR